MKIQIIVSSMALACALSAHADVQVVVHQSADQGDPSATITLSGTDAKSLAEVLGQANLPKNQSNGFLNSIVCLSKDQCTIEAQTGIIMSEKNEDLEALQELYGDQLTGIMSGDSIVRVPTLIGYDGPKQSPLDVKLYGLLLGALGKDSNVIGDSNKIAVSTHDMTLVCYENAPCEFQAIITKTNPQKD